MVTINSSSQIWIGEFEAHEVGKELVRAGCGAPEMLQLIKNARRDCALYFISRSL